VHETPDNVPAAGANDDQSNIELGCGPRQTAGGGVTNRSVGPRDRCAVHDLCRALAVLGDLQLSCLFPVRSVWVDRVVLEINDMQDGQLAVDHPRELDRDAQCSLTRAMLVVAHQQPWLSAGRRLIRIRLGLPVAHVVTATLQATTPGRDHQPWAVQIQNQTLAGPIAAGSLAPAGPHHTRLA
jgi:hypothetical protein